MDCANDLRALASRDLDYGPAERDLELRRQAKGWAEEAERLARRVWEALSGVGPPGLAEE